MIRSKVRFPELSQRILKFEIRSIVSKTHNFLDTIQSVYFCKGCLNGFINTTLTQDCFSGKIEIVSITRTVFLKI